ncbi:PAQR family membrane homeostasis protein TrhA [Litoreibacter roseus]|uniref:Hemolysin III family protein n=1 Tax=Litoreibacter roseus TaxID=2601869 RepID=A0A6N6JN62_9RHOB|nr:hemolysin III family protein [Litoreibacter roseus]GFE66949.1 hemolysin III family protein [Litoreibacter roseus]
MYPTAAKTERIADGAVHAVGVLAAVSGAVIMMWQYSGLASSAQLTALAIYSATLIATFVASAAYHLLPWHGVRPLLRRIDHAAIYLKIAGTYTPLVVMIGSTFAYVILVVVWTLAVIGIAVKVFFWDKRGPFGTVLYLTMGWLSVGLISSIWPIVPGSVVALIAIGGLTYTAGVIFYTSERKFTTAIWHGFVVAASGCFWAAITIGAMATI